ncbi:MAG: tetratricopeptide repeat protein [Brevinematales bacterium]|nr:tetratricopeptide repeat protein [Brevinematales bacterium]
MKRVVKICLVVLASVGYAQGLSGSLFSSQIEAQYAYGVSLAYEGKREEALLVLGQLAENGYHNPYSFQMILSISSSLLQQKNFALMPAEKLFSLVDYLADLAYTNYATNREVLYGYLDVKKALGQWGDFENGLSQLLAIDPENVLGNFYRGFLLYNQQRFEQAKKFLWKVITNGQEDENARQPVYQSYFLLGLIELRRENYREGVALLEKAKSLFDQDYNLDRYLAFGYQQLLEVKKAYDLVKNIPEILYSADVALIRIQTSFFLGLKDWERLASAYEKDAPLARAYRLYAQKKYREAISLVNDLMKEYEVEPVRVFYANYLRLKAAEALQDRKIRREMLFLLGYYAHQVGKLDLSLQYISPLEEEKDLRLEAILTLGSLYEEAGKYSEAIKRYEQYLKEAPQDVLQEKGFDLYLALAFLYTKTSNAYRANLSYAQAEKLAKTPEQYYRFWYYSGLISQQKNLHLQAIDAFQKAKGYSNTAEVNYSLANSLFLLQRLEDATKALETSLALEPSASSYNLLAYIYALTRTSLDTALVYIRKALDEDPENIAYQDTLGWIYYQQGEYEKALEVFAWILLKLDGVGDMEGLDEVYYHIGMVYEALNRPGDARLMWEKGLSINPKNGYIRERLFSR